MPAANVARDIFMSTAGSGIPEKNSIYKINQRDRKTQNKRKKKPEGFQYFLKTMLPANRESTIEMIVSITK